MIFKKITIIHLEKPENSNINVELQWLGSSLGLFNLRDKDKSCFRIFIELLKAAKKGTSLSSDALAYRLGLSRGTIIHHIHKLAEKGIVKKIDNKYMLRMSRLTELLNEVRNAFLENHSALLDVAKEIDDKLDLL